MVDFIVKLIIKIVFALVLYFGVSYFIFSSLPMTDFLLSLLAAHFLLDKLNFDAKSRS